MASRLRVAPRGGCGPASTLAGSEAFKEAIVHRQETRASRVRNRPQLAFLTPIHGSHRHGFDPSTTPANLDQHLGFDLIPGGVQMKRSERVDPKDAKAAL